MCPPEKRPSRPRFAQRGHDCRSNGRNQLVAVNLRSGFLVLNSVTDHKTYEINFDPSKFAVDDNWRQGTDVRVLTRFDGSRYTAQNVTIISPAKQ